MSKNIDFEFDELFEQNPRKGSLFGSDEVDRINSPSLDHPNLEIGDEGELDPKSSKVNLEHFSILKLIGKGAYGKVSDMYEKIFYNLQLGLPNYEKRYVRDICRESTEKRFPCEHKEC
jgi:hypothetical protein